MALKIALKPNEKIVVNGAVIANGDKSARLHFLNNACFLREKDIMQEEDATRDEDFLYYLVQLIYLDSDNTLRYRMQLDYAVNSLGQAYPDKTPEMEKLLSLVDSGHVYEALKECKKLFPTNNGPDSGKQSSDAAE